MPVRTTGLMLLFLVACQGGEMPEPTEASMAADRDRAEVDITARMHGFTRWFRAGDLDSLGMLVTDDYHALVPNRTALEGKGPWLEWMGRLVAQGRWTEDLTSDHIELSGPVAVQRGRFVVLFEPASGGAAVSDTGKFLWHWRRVDGQWYLAEAAWSSDRP